MGYVSGNGWIDRSFADGMRESLYGEFTDIYILNLRGDIRKNMLSKGTAKEGGNIFDSGSMTGISITLFVKNPRSESPAKLHYYAVADDLSGQEKRALISDVGSVSAMENDGLFNMLSPDRHNDWIGHRDSSLESFIIVGSKDIKVKNVLFSKYTMGIKTNRDAWVYRSSRRELVEDMKKMIGFFNSESARYENGLKDGSVSESVKVEDFVDLSSANISWSRSLRNDVRKMKTHYFDENMITIGLHRPFTKRHVYFDRNFVNDVALNPKFYPTPNHKNVVITLSGIGARAGFSTIISSDICDLHTLDTCQCFPLYLYEKTSMEMELFSKEEGQLGYTRVSAITDVGLDYFHRAYPKEGSQIRKEDIFYYVYGLLHSPEYRSRFAGNLSKELPRIAPVKEFTHFLGFSKAGRDLAHWHLNFETAEIYQDAELDCGKRELKTLSASDYRVTKMIFAKVKDPVTKKSIGDKSIVIYNEHITIKNIPLEAYDYVVNAKPAIEWVMDRQAVTTDKKSGIINDANDWAIETMGDAKYPLELLLRVITVSLETMKIINNLPKFEIE